MFESWNLTLAGGGLPHPRLQPALAASWSVLPTAFLCPYHLFPHCLLNYKSDLVTILLKMSVMLLGLWRRISVFYILSQGSLQSDPCCFLLLQHLQPFHSDFFSGPCRTHIHLIKVVTAVITFPLEPVLNSKKASTAHYISQDLLVFDA